MKAAAYAMIATLALAGCATQQLSPADQSEAQRPIECSDKAQCDRYWSRAQVFVAQHSGYRIQIANESIISTFGPFGSSTDLAWNVTRLANSTGGATISASVSCANIFGCIPQQSPTLLQFRRFVMQ